jgi:hypothetical protein
MIVCARPAPMEGASRSSRQSGAGCDGRRGIARRARPRRTAKSCGPGAPTLALSLAKTGDVGPDGPDTPARRRWLKSPVHRGEHEDKPLKPIAQGMPDCFGEPVVTNACAFYQRTRGCGCAKHPAFPVPSILSRADDWHNSGKSCRGNADAWPQSCRGPSFETHAIACSSG